MNKKWHEKTTLEKLMDIISFITIFVWLIFIAIEYTIGFAGAEIVNRICSGIICACLAVSFWSVKRIVSYISIVAVVCALINIILMLV